MILSRGTVMTRGGLEALKQQLWAEAMRHGLAQAQEVLVIADLENHRDRLDYRGAQERGEPLGIGAMESTCKQISDAVSSVGPVLDERGRRGVDVCGNLLEKWPLVAALSTCPSRF
jgi:hypothetical protein